MSRWIRCADCNKKLFYNSPKKKTLKEDVKGLLKIFQPTVIDPNKERLCNHCEHLRMERAYNG